MQTTQNYNLSIVEGTDKYNHLTVDNPNYEIIDEQMKKNEVATIAIATEATTGTVHAIELTQVDNNVFRFTATSIWHAGDTMTINDAQVTALLSDGSTLGEGSYTIGAEVLCVKNGQRVTVFVQRGQAESALDSERLGGQLPEFYATATAVELAQSSASAAGVLAQQNSNSIDTINGKLNGALAFDSFDVDNISLAGGAVMNTQADINIKREGYYAVIYATRVLNATQAGANYLNVYCSSATYSGETVYVRGRNTGTAAAKVAVRLYVMYVKSELIAIDPTTQLA